MSFIDWKKILILCCFSLLIFWSACASFGNQGVEPGIDGRIMLGSEMIISKVARAVKIGAFLLEDFDMKKGLPKKEAKPIASAEVTNFQVSKYLFRLDLKKQTQSFILYALLDQDNSGGFFPNHNDVYGLVEKPIFLGGYRIQRTLVLNKHYKDSSSVVDKAGVSGELSLGLGVKLLASAKKITLMAFHTDDFDLNSDLPKSGVKPAAKSEFTKLDFLPGHYDLVTKRFDKLMFVIAILDQDNSGGELITPGDIYGVPKDNPIFMGKLRKNNVPIILNKLYRPAIQVTLSLGIYKASQKAKKMVFGLFAKDKLDPKGLYPLDMKSASFTHEISNFSQKKTTFLVEPGGMKKDLYPFVFLDQDGSDSLTKGDVYAVWKKAPLPMKTSTDKPVFLTLDSTFH